MAAATGTGSNISQAFYAKLVPHLKAGYDLYNFYIWHKKEAFRRQMNLKVSNVLIPQNYLSALSLLLFLFFAAITATCVLPSFPPTDHSLARAA